MSRDLQQCQDCQRITPLADCPPARDLHERLDQGGKATTHECPDCGALVYPAEIPQLSLLDLAENIDSAWETVENLADLAEDMNLDGAGVPEGAVLNLSNALIHLGEAIVKIRNAHKEAMGG